MGKMPYTSPEPRFPSPLQSRQQGRIGSTSSEGSLPMQHQEHGAMLVRGEMLQCPHSSHLGVKSTL